MQGNLEQKNKMDRIKDLSLDQKAKLYYMGLVKKGEIDTLPEDPKAAFVRDMMDKEKPMDETDAISTARSLRPGGEEDEEQDEYDKGWYGESLRESASQLGYLKEVDGMEKGMDLNAMQYKKVEFVYTEQGGRFYGLDVYVSKDQPQRSAKLRYNEANEWLKDTLNYIHEDDLIPRQYISGLEDLDLIVDRLRELGIEASHGDYMDIS